MRIALIFDRTTRPETTGFYCERALRRLANVEIIEPNKLTSTGTNENFDIFLNIDDGFRYRLPEWMTPSAYWAIDTHLDLGWAQTKSNDFDFVMAAQKQGSQDLAQVARSVHWLPLACDPHIHRKHRVEKEYDVCFVGHIVGNERERLVGLIQRKCPNSFVGNAYFHDMARIYSASRIVFNRSVNNDVNMRVFEALACGSLLLTNTVNDNGQEELFQDGVHLVTYRDDDELLDKVEFYLKHEDQRERIAAAGRREVLARHTYMHRMQSLLSTVERGAGSRSCINSPNDMVYYDFARPDLLNFVPQSAERILEVGCGTGRLGETIKQRQRAEVVGVEVNSEAAAIARARLDRVIEIDVETITDQFTDGEFDCVICGDVLEHLHDPARLLSRIRQWLADTGALVVSLPNARNASVVTGLLRGNWTYQFAGLMDETHLRFFTKRDMVALFEQAGLIIDTLEGVHGPEYSAWKELGEPGEVTDGDVRITGLTAEDAEEFYIYQYLFRLRPSNQACPDESATVCQQNDEPTAPIQSDEPQSDLRRITAAQRTRLKVLYVGDFKTSGKSEQYAASALKAIGHDVECLHDESISTPEALIALLNRGPFDCLLFHKGCLGAKTLGQRLHPTGEAIAQMLRASKVPGYTWYFDRVYDYDFDRSREHWMRLVAPLCRVAFVTDGALARTDWARWHLLRQGISKPTVNRDEVPEDSMVDVGFVGQIYGERHRELNTLTSSYQVHLIQGVFGTQLSREIRRHRIIIGPKFPSIPHYWSNRLYVVLGHGGFFLAPEVDGMRSEGFIPGVHYALLGEDPLGSVEYWLRNDAKRKLIAQRGQELVLSQFTYEHRAREMARIIGETL